MANTFKLKTKANLTTNAINHADALIYTSPNATHTVVLSISLSNTSASSKTVDVQIVSDTNDVTTNANVYLGKTLPIPSGGTLEIMQGNKLVLEDTDAIRARCSSGSSADILVSVMEIT
tara:strand:+ start:27 stop:383 length:357 start_codon:yes stop_codon:yes gene_type:complete